MVAASSVIAYKAAGRRRHADADTSKAQTVPFAPPTPTPAPFPNRRPLPSEAQVAVLGAPRETLARLTLQSRIGIVMPELFDAFPRRAPGMSVWDAVATGFDAASPSSCARAVWKQQSVSFAPCEAVERGRFAPVASCEPAGVRQRVRTCSDCVTTSARSAS
ncbi:hypothetical protein DFH09DRAFT_289458 [Mycena vulgaris]|nr:hypothetical protein DFH09DRAFT_289458 [Mycena vulgaris]